MAAGWKATKLGGGSVALGEGGRTGEDEMGEERCLGRFTGPVVAVCLLLWLVVV